VTAPVSLCRQGGPAARAHTAAPSPSRDTLWRSAGAHMPSAGMFGQEAVCWLLPVVERPAHDRWVAVKLAGDIEVEAEAISRTSMCR
jgi:hypothetical protein